MLPTSRIPVVLDLAASSYTKWRTFFTVMLGKFDFLHHVDGTGDPSSHSDWVKQDFTILTWLYGSILDEILDIIMEPTQSTHELWTTGEQLFHDNKESRAIYLTVEFGAVVQGDMTITTYYKKLKSITDALCDVDQSVSDKILVLNVLRGLSPFLSQAASAISLQAPFPSFIRAHSMLLLDKMHVNNTEKVTASTVLLSTASSGAGHVPSSCGDQSRSGKNYSKNKGRLTKTTAVVTTTSPTTEDLHRLLIPRSSTHHGMPRDSSGSTLGVPLPASAFSARVHQPANPRRTPRHTHHPS